MPAKVGLHLKKMEWFWLLFYNLFTFKTVFAPEITVILKLRTTKKCI